MLDSMKIIGDFILCEDVTPKVDRGLFFATPEDDRMSADNLHIFKVVKLPEHDIDTSKYLGVKVGDEVISISLGSDLKIDDKNYKLFELKYITAKVA